MSKNYVIGFPRIGEKRELKKVLEQYWSKQTDFNEVKYVASQLKKRHWNYQKDAKIDFIASNDFSYYDNMLDTTILLGAIPQRFQNLKDEELYFAMARGNETSVAMEMTKWFNTNYHYIVPEISKDTKFTLNSKKVIEEYKEALELGIKTKINLIGAITYLGLSKSIDNSDIFTHINSVVEVYKELLLEISKLDDEIVVEFAEPLFVKDLDTKVLSLIKPVYDALAEVSKNIKIVVTTYFEHSNEATKILVNTPIWALGLDFIHGNKNLEALEFIKNSNKVLIAGVIDGRNIWKSNFEDKVALLNKISNVVSKENIIVGTSCSLLHVPFTLNYEEKLDSEIKSWLAFAVEKLKELSLVTKQFFDLKLSLEDSAIIKRNVEENKQRKISSKIHNKVVQDEIKNLKVFERADKFQDRIKVQREFFKYDALTTTTIGSFPQTPEIRENRKQYKANAISKEQYVAEIKKYIDDCVAFQDEIGLDVLVHGEPERNDMVEYFGELMEGFAFTQNAWVQSYGSRCVKPPLIFGDVSRPNPMTVEWIKYAQSKTKKVMKGMLTGPVTILNWSFVRDDIPRNEVTKQIALAINKEVDDLQNAGIKMIQVDEAAFKEGYPLRIENIKAYENWAVENFRLSVSCAKADTQIHTHMCYSEFNDIIKTIEAMDADVISIETARSGNRLLKIFKEVAYKQEIGPGIYDIHSPRVPSVEEMVNQIKALIEVLPKEQLWINPDCGLKTRKWPEVKQSLINLVEAVKIVKNSN
ncbi:5-methyltetrahydropteroyltriglutamate--homocysteine S-methyltransferase [Aliarcobacter butzleri]|jgi:5-methyltetrahydropteroyltriglutamate--homocysteine methyltransferase|uniref:5-methyltetrahydropteroyltriglutamate--homocysteine methyltransferase n=3 Tax=Aliarcobacter butzleri TaxID=28197 RepID=A0AAW7PWE9_9BACT|nr:5-methyltetrahydropteroyltriglutamate--homocysteine S-methyltransferase [Aliarcobacter butzleri]EFU69865.1 5-methyltetrahydropteroyltriglutamate--homocysteine S-methyltransferase [Aliarcobacter butzleri JV22]KLE11127.1 5-methyltetrahydropteroyltriglutamate--homocysteine methyltransferase [Aliarcobacter butzleri L355]MBF7065910.1 5-methyltetrahydropteroyltriglutamate--homocysteine S-methyltransferase [Aliarcobacter butzleri]MCG3661388.1 5-methyltetrahydropteroyltriglutamate--homocysteine S-me